MSDITEHGRRTIDEIAARHGLSTSAVEEMARALVRGGGTMAQFNIPELGGSGQWMAGGMTMVGDMFNTGLKLRVENLCGELLSALADGELFTRPQTVAGVAWWPEGLGSPAAVGGQNQVRYAYFAEPRRIAFDPGNGAPVIMLDTGEHRIGGFSQQQSGIGDGFAGITFSSQIGQFPLASLSRAIDATQPDERNHGQASPPASRQAQTQGQRLEPSPGGFQGQSQGQYQGQPLGGFQAQSQGQTPARPAEPVGRPPEKPEAADAPKAAKPTPAVETVSGTDLLALIEKLAALHSAGILTDAEFAEKKAELLARL